MGVYEENIIPIKVAHLAEYIYYENKTTQHIKTNALKEGLVINEVKFE